MSLQTRCTFSVKTVYLPDKTEYVIHIINFKKALNHLIKVLKNFVE